MRDYMGHWYLRQCLTWNKQLETVEYLPCSSVDMKGDEPGIVRAK